MVGARNRRTSTDARRQNPEAPGAAQAQSWQDTGATGRRFILNLELRNGWKRKLRLGSFQPFLSSRLIPLWPAM
jgi:hypothetical protein